MLRFECRSTRAEAVFTLSPKLLAIGLGIALAACSADISRLDPPFGLTTSSSRISSTPVIPPEGMLGGGSRLADSTPYDTYSSTPYDTYRPAPRNDYATAPRTYDRGGSEYRPSYGTNPSYRGSYGGYDAGRRVASAPPSSDSRTAYQPSYPARPSSTYQPPTAYEGQRPSYAAQPRPQSEVAALSPEATQQPYRTVPGPDSTKRVTAPYAAQPATSRPNPSSNPRLIDVQPGDTLIGIADRYNVSISELMSINGLSSPVLQPGKRLLLPQNAKLPVATARQTTPGPEAKQVAALNDRGPTVAPVSVSDARPRDEAPIRYSDDLDAEESSAASSTHTIQKGESLYRIAVRYGVPLAELQRINGISDPRKVRVGTVLKLPTASGANPSAVASGTAEPASAKAQPSERTRPATTPVAIDAVGEAPSKPVIINARTKIAKLEDGKTANDAGPITAVPSVSADKSPADDSKASAEEQADGVGKFRWPVKGRIIAGFGKQADGSYSDGITLAVPAGTDVHAAESGVVAYAGDELKDYGNLVLIRHDNGWITAYAHNSELQVKRGDRVRRGQVIAKAGNTGNVDRPQLLFELRKGSSPVDPIPHMEKL